MILGPVLAELFRVKVEEEVDSEIDETDVPVHQLGSGGQLDVVGVFGCPGPVVALDALGDGRH